MHLVHGIELFLPVLDTMDDIGSKFLLHRVQPRLSPGSRTPIGLDAAWHNVLFAAVTAKQCVYLYVLQDPIHKGWSILAGSMVGGPCWGSTGHGDLVAGSVFTLNVCCSIP